jgi:hypothetical protein
MPLSKIDSDSLNSGLTFSGQQTIPTINLTGGQITFPATAVPSANANTLDDYEEGTWTPIIGAVTLTNAGRYTKIGRLVHISFANQSGIAVVAAGDTTSCANLPFAVVANDWPNTDAAVVIWANQSTGYKDELACGRLSNSSIVSMTNRGTEATTTIDPWGMSLTYYTS